MKLKDIVAEDFINYKLPSMFLITPNCDFKCCIEAGMNINICQNSRLAKIPTKEYSNEFIYYLYHSNDITKAVVIGGLEPLYNTEEVISLIKYFRDMGDDCDFVIYTGYNKDEIPDTIKCLAMFMNVVIKYGRFIPNSKSRYDETLGVVLASDNQYAERIS